MPLEGNIRAMEPAQGDTPKLPDMVMCGDHPSFTKTELNMKEDKPDTPQKEKPPMSYPKISPSTSRTEEPTDRSRTISDHALRLIEARRRVRSMEAVPRSEDSVPGNRALVQAALGSFRWPPYLVAVWVLVLLLTHVLHCLVSLLERSLPSVRKFCQYFRAWTEECWKSEAENRLYPLGLACATGLLYVLYFGLYAVYCVTVWAVEPLLTDEDKRDVETKVTNYIDEVNSKTNSSSKS